jgi:hypothetical protein
MIDVETYPTIYDSIDRASRKSKPQSDRLLGPLFRLDDRGSRPDRGRMRETLGSIGRVRERETILRRSPFLACVRLP